MQECGQQSKNIFQSTQHICKQYEFGLDKIYTSGIKISVDKEGVMNESLTLFQQITYIHMSNDVILDVINIKQGWPVEDIVHYCPW